MANSLGSRTGATCGPSPRPLLSCGRAPRRRCVAPRASHGQQQQRASQLLVGLDNAPLDQQLAAARQQEQQEQPSHPGLILPGAPDAPQRAAAGKKQLRLSWAGSGIYFWWQLGVMQWLAQRYDLTRVPMGGASGGALAAALARCGVDAEEITESAYRLSLQHRIWERPLGLVGVWGSIIETWLHELLPADAAARCSGGMGVVVTQLPSCRQLWIDSYRDKEDVVNCCMASAHVPVLLDWKMARPCRGAPCVDGSFPDFFKGGNCAHIELGGDAVVIDYFDDPLIKRSGRMDMLQLKEMGAIRRLVKLGAAYAARLEDMGVYERFDMEGLARGAGAGAGAAAPHVANGGGGAAVAGAPAAAAAEAAAEAAAPQAAA